MEENIRPAKPGSVSIKKAAELLDVSIRTIYNKINDGSLKTVRVGFSQRVMLNSIPDIDGSVSIKKAIEMMGVCRTTLNSMIRDERVKTIRIFDKHTRILVNSMPEKKSLEF